MKNVKEHQVVSTYRSSRPFRATVEYVVLHGCDTWTVNKEMLNRLDGCFVNTTPSYCAQCGLDRKITHTLKIMVMIVPPVSCITAKRTLKFAGPALSDMDQPISDLILQLV